MTYSGNKLDTNDITMHLVAIIIELMNIYIYDY